MSAEPQRDDDWRVQLTCLAGLGSFGHNCLRLAWQDEDERGGPRSLVVDCGARYPRRLDGVDVEHAPFVELSDGSLRAVVLTHGHEDHIGGLPYLLEAVAAGDSPPTTIDVWGHPHALSLCRRRLRQYPDPGVEIVCRAVVGGERFEIAGMSVEANAVEHSIPGALSYAFNTAAGRLVHTGDFKLSGVGEAESLAGFKRWGREGVELLLSDSTNVLAAGKTRSEADVARALESHVAGARGAVLVPLFASNLERIIHLERIAARHGRRLCLVGRSLHRHVEVGRELGLVTWSAERCVAPEKAGALDRAGVLYLLTGSQGEGRAGFARAATGDHPYVRCHPGDLVLYSARIIPGSERAVHTAIAHAMRAGADVVTPYDDPTIHTSGHAKRAEQEMLIRACQPRMLVPLHGTRLHLERHAALARSSGVPRTEVLENGEGLQWHAGSWSRIRNPACAETVARQRGVVLTPAVTSQRHRLGRFGLVVATISGRAAGDPRTALTVRGISLVADEIAELRNIVRESARDTVHPDPVRRGIERWFSRHPSATPEIVVEALS